MAACTASPKVSQVFRGDDEALLDHLLVACHAHKLRNQPLESFGRDLVPYFSPDEVLAPLPSKNWQSCGSPPRSGGSRGGRKVVAGVSSTSPSRATTTTTVSRSSAKPRASTDLPAVKAPRNRTFGGFLCGTASASPVSSAASLGTPQQLSSRSSFTSMGSSPPAACPAFFSSPKPEAIPMPTTGLLSSALLRAAECKAAPALHTARGFAIPTAAA